MTVLGYTRGDILRYIFLPQILPRIRELFESGFSHLAFLMAQVFRAGGILPDQHAYLRSGSIGTYGMLDVLSAAAALVPFNRQHLDKVVFFFAILAGLVILAIQFILLLVSLAVGPALAQEAKASPFSNILITQNPSEDIALRLMDRVFGVPGMFGSMDAPSSVTGFHAALHSLLQFYSLGLLVIAAIILAYFVFAIVAETAETGTPFGKRYNHVWAPVRLVVAFGLLIPIGYGLNSGQWITLHVAKFGSGFATNGWLKFNQVLGDQYKMLSDQDGGEELVHTPERPDISALVMFMNMARTCDYATRERHGFQITAYLVKNPADTAVARTLSSTDYKTARKFFNESGDIFIRFGQYNRKLYSDQKGHVFPYCGEVMLPTGDTHREGAKVLNEFYYGLIKSLWEGNIGDLNKYAENDAACGSQIESFRKKCQPNARPADFSETIISALNEKMDKAIEESVKAQRAEFLKGIYGESKDGQRENASKELKKYGWGGAGIYYNTVATMNGAIATSLYNHPYPLLMPFVMQQKREELEKSNRSASSRADALRGTGDRSDFIYLGDEEIFDAIERTQSYWRAQLSSRNTDNIIIDVINLILGTGAIFDMCKNADVHPLAQLAGVGRALVESATRNLGLALISSIGSIGLGASSYTQMLGSVAAAASSFYVTFAMIGLMIGFLMYYVIPFMPFLYFFFAVTGWVKGVFEAMVGVPLWALAHLRIDGQGLPGDAAVQGYYLLLEIFLRPILIVFGLLAAIAVFAAMVRVLNDIFVLVVSNVGGFSVENIDLCTSKATSEAPTGSADYFRGPIDQFFFTVVYAIVVYLIGTSSFKMIDAVPNKVLRWMGTSVNSFGDITKDAGEGLLNKLSIGGYAITSQLQGAFGQVGNFFQNDKGQGAVSAGVKFISESQTNNAPAPSADKKGS